MKSDFITSLENIFHSLVPFWANKLLSTIGFGNEYSMLISLLLTQFMKFFMNQSEEKVLCFAFMVLVILGLLQSGILDVSKINWIKYVEIKEEFSEPFEKRFIQLNNALLKEVNQIPRKPVWKVNSMQFQICPTNKFIWIQGNIYVKIEWIEQVEAKPSSPPSPSSKKLNIIFRQYKTTDLVELSNFMEDLVQRHPLKPIFEWKLIKEDNIDGLTTTIKALHHYAIQYMNLEKFSFLNKLNIYEKYKNVNDDASEPEPILHKKQKNKWKYSPTLKKEEEEEENQEKELNNFLFPSIQNQALPAPFEHIYLTVNNTTSFKKETENRENKEYLMVAENKQQIEDFLKFILTEYKEKHTQKYTYISTISEERTKEFTIYPVLYSDVCFAINYYLVTKMNISFSNYELDIRSSLSKYKNISFFRINCPQRIKLNEDMKLIITESKTTNIEAWMHGCYLIEYKFVSKKDNISDFILPILKEYRKFHAEKVIEFTPKKKNLYHFIYNGMKQNKPSFTTIILSQPGTPFENFETFEHLHQEHSEQFKNDLLKLNDLEYYRKRGLKRKKGYLFHGKPGTGKTSSVIAMALFSERHIISINFTILKYQHELEEIMNLSSINDHEITFNNTILLFDEIECGLQQYTREVAPCAPPPPENQTMMFGISETNDEVFMTPAFSTPCETESRLDIAKILTSMDGVGGGNGRVLVGTTNYLNKIDPAFYRDLRMTPFEFRELRQQDAIQIIQKYFDSTLSPEEQSRIPDRHMVPAKLIQLCMVNENLSCNEFLDKVFPVLPSVVGGTVSLGVNSNLTVG